MNSSTFGFIALKFFIVIAILPLLISALTKKESADSRHTPLGSP